MTAPTASTPRWPTRPRRLAGARQLPARAWWPTAASAGRRAPRWCPRWPTAMPRVSGGGRRLVFTLRAATPASDPPANRAVRPSDVKAQHRAALPGARRRGGGSSGTSGARREFERTHSGGISGHRGARRRRTRWRSRSPRRIRPILRVLALPFAFVVPQGTPPADQSTAGPLRAGPYRIADYEPGAQHRAGAQPRLRAGRGRAGDAPGPTASTCGSASTRPRRSAASAAGTIDYVQPRPSAPEELAAAEAAGSRARMHRWVEGTTYYFFMNTRRAPFNDVRVRRAVNLAIDRSALARRVPRRGRPPVAGAAARGARPPRVEAAPPPTSPRARALVAGRPGPPARRCHLGPHHRALPAGHAAPGSHPARRSACAPRRASGIARRCSPRSPTRRRRRRSATPAGSRTTPTAPTGSPPPVAGRHPRGRQPQLLAARRRRPRPAHRPRRPRPGTAGPAPTRWAGVDRAVARLAPWAPFANSVRIDITSRGCAGLRGPPALRFPLDAGAARVTTGMLRKGSSTMEGEAWPRWTGTRGTAR